MSQEDRDAREDEQLIEAARGGDADAFDTLYLRYRDWVVRLAHRWTGSPEDALDVLQETFTYVLRKLPALELRARFTTFLYPVVRNLSWAGQRRIRRQHDAEPVPEPLAPAAEPHHEDLAHALGNLPAAQRDVVLLRFVDGLSMAEVASALDVPVGTVKSRLHHALRALRQDPRTRAYFLDED